MNGLRMMSAINRPLREIFPEHQSEFFGGRNILTFYSSIQWWASLYSQTSFPASTSPLGRVVLLTSSSTRPWC